MISHYKAETKAEESITNWLASRLNVVGVTRGRQWRLIVFIASSWHANILNRFSLIERVCNKPPPSTTTTSTTTTSTTASCSSFKPTSQANYFFLAQLIHSTKKKHFHNNRSSRNLVLVSWKPRKHILTIWFIQIFVIFAIESHFTIGACPFRQTAGPLNAMLVSF